MHPPPSLLPPGGLPRRWLGLCPSTTNLLALAISRISFSSSSLSSSTRCCFRLAICLAAALRLGLTASVVTLAAEGAGLVGFWTKQYSSSSLSESASSGTSSSSSPFSGSGKWSAFLAAFLGCSLAASMLLRLGVMEAGVGTCFTAAPPMLLLLLMGVVGGEAATKVRSTGRFFFEVIYLGG